MSVVFLLQCTEVEQTGVAIAVKGKINVDKVPEKYLSSVDFVPLQTTEESLLGKIENVLLTDDAVFIKHMIGLERSVAEFSRDGEFLGSIGRRGRAENEYMGLSGFAVNDYDGYVYIFDPMRCAALKYTVAGDYVSTVKPEDKAIEQIIPFIIDARFFTQDSMIVTMSVNFQTDIIQCVLPADLSGMRVLARTGYRMNGGYIYANAPVAVAGGRVFMLRPVEDNIYELSGGEVFPAAYLDNGTDLSAEVRDIATDDYSKLVTELFKRGVFPPSEIHVCGNTMLLRYMTLSYLINLDTMTAVEVVDEHDDYKRFPFIPFNVKASDENAFVGLMSAGGFMMYADEDVTSDKSLRERVRVIASGLSEEQSNPVLVFYNMK